MSSVWCGRSSSGFRPVNSDCIRDLLERTRIWTARATDDDWSVIAGASTARSGSSAISPPSTHCHVDSHPMALFALSRSLAAALGGREKSTQSHRNLWAAVGRAYVWGLLFCALQSINDSRGARSGDFAPYTSGHRALESWANDGDLFNRIRYS